MGAQAAAPINEAVSLLSRTDPVQLEQLKHKYPALEKDLQLGKFGGETLDELNRDRATVMVAALDAARAKAASVLPELKRRMKRARQRRLLTQVATVIGSSGVIAGLIAVEPRVTQVTAVVTLVASLGTLLAENLESLSSPGAGTIYQAYERTSALAYKAELAKTELELLIKHSADNEEVAKAIAEANALCFELNTWADEVGGSASVETRPPIDLSRTSPTG